jgi:hypothetical protein
MDETAMVITVFTVELPDEGGGFSTTLHLPATMDARAAHHYKLEFIAIVEKGDDDSTTGRITHRN